MELASLSRVALDDARRQFGDPEEGEHPLFEAVARELKAQRYSKL
jgi:hypothetical protein